MTEPDYSVYGDEDSVDICGRLEEKRGHEDENWAFLELGNCQDFLYENEEGERQTSRRKVSGSCAAAVREEWPRRSMYSRRQR